MPAEPGAVLVQAARHSNELWTEVRETFRLLSNADFQIERYYRLSNPAYRQESLVTSARDNLRNAEPKLTHIAGVFKLFEEEERRQNLSEIARE